MKTQEQSGDLKVEVKEVWATPNDITLDDLIVEMERIGNKVITIDRENNRLGLAIGEE